MDWPRTRICHAFVTASESSRHFQTGSIPFATVHRQTLANCFQRMSTFDSNPIQKAVTEFTPKRPAKFQELLAAKELIAELRRKRASYESIADLLTQHCLPISKSAIAMFCHEVLGESVRSRRRPGKKRLSVLPRAENQPLEPAKTNSSAMPPAPIANANGSENPATRSRGPHIAKIELLKPGEQYD